LFRLQTIHNANFIHRDLHSGNILYGTEGFQIGDLGLSQSVINNLSNNEIYGVISYIAPEILNGSSFSQASDIYSMGMIMWEFTTGCKPFANVEHDINLIYEIIGGKRPEITYDTPECIVNLMKRCWDSNPSKRPTIEEIKGKTFQWYFNYEELEQFDRSEKKRLKLIQSMKLGPEFSEEPHPKAIFTSRALNSLISNTRQGMYYIYLIMF